MVDDQNAHEHVSELHKLNQEALASFRTLEAEIEAHLPPPARVKTALAKHRKTLETAVSASQLKANDLAPNKPAPEKTAPPAPPPPES